MVFRGHYRRLHLIGETKSAPGIYLVNDAGGETSNYFAAPE